MIFHTNNLPTIWKKCQKKKKKKKIKKEIIITMKERAFKWRNTYLSEQVEAIKSEE